MKKIVVFSALLVLLSGVACTRLKGPEGMPSKDKFVYIGNRYFVCGEMRFFNHGAETDLWRKGLLGESENPLVVTHRKEVGGQIVIDVWLDRNQDGYFDEHFKSADELETKYPTPCDAIKK